jgi:hypothetical protein
VAPGLVTRDVLCALTNRRRSASPVRSACSGTDGFESVRAHRRRCPRSGSGEKRSKP